MAVKILGGIVSNVFTTTKHYVNERSILLPPPLTLTHFSVVLIYFFRHGIFFTRTEARKDDDARVAAAEAHLVSRRSFKRTNVRRSFQAESFCARKRELRRRPKMQEQSTKKRTQKVVRKTPRKLLEKCIFHCTEKRCFPG